MTNYRHKVGHSHLVHLCSAVFPTTTNNNPASFMHSCFAMKLNGNCFNLTLYSLAGAILFGKSLCTSHACWGAFLQPDRHFRFLGVCPVMQVRNSIMHGHELCSHMALECNASDHSTFAFLVHCLLSGPPLQSWPSTRWACAQTSSSAIEEDQNELAKPNFSYP